MVKDKLNYQIRLEEGGDLQDVYRTLLSILNAQNGVEVSTEEKKAIGFEPETADAPKRLAVLSYKGVGYKAALELKEECISLTCELIDRLTLSLVKTAGTGLGIRIYSPLVDSYLPKDPRLLDAAAGVLKPELKNAISEKGFEPLFYFADSLLFYASFRENGTIHLLNNYLLKFFLDYGLDKGFTEEFSYQVAPSLKLFVPMFDFGLIPVGFYDYYKKPRKIVNHSGFDIYNIKRKVFVKPYILELKYGKQTFHKLAGEGSSLIYCDKIQEGETLDSTLRRILKNELKIADDYIGAVVHRAVEFDRDKNQRLTPRLLVNVFIEEVKNRTAAEERAGRTWISREETERYCS